eukprot:IDg13000t1
MTVDDGCGDGMCDLTLDKRLTDAATGALSSLQIMDKSRNESEAEFKAFKNSIRARIRAMHGFAHVVHEEAADTVVAVAPTPREGMLAFLDRFATNVEHRWKEHHSNKM